MSDTDTNSTEKWNTIVNESGSAQSAAPTSVASGSAPAQAAAYGTLPELPMFTILRLPVRYDTRRAVLLLPQAYREVRCAFLSANTGVFGDKCLVDNTDIPVPAVRDARPSRNGDAIIVNFWKERTDGGSEIGPGYKDSAYPGGQIEPLPIDLGVPYVEVGIWVSRTLVCGCDDSDNGGWG